MLLTIDIGNTNISCGIFKGKTMAERFDIPTARYSRKRLVAALGRVTLHRRHCEEPPSPTRHCEEPPKGATKQSLQYHSGISDTVICSVVPALTIVLKKDLSRLLGRTPYIIGKGLKVPIKNLYRRPKQVGQDRLVNGFAAAAFYGAPAIVVDSGTALTFDVISARKEYLGGMILPGLELCLDALYERTALLPRAKLTVPAEFIGRDSAGSILSGLVYGFAGLTDSLIAGLKSKIGSRAKVIATGGNIRLIKRYSKGIDIVDRGLTLKGLALLYGRKD